MSRLIPAPRARPRVVPSSSWALSWALTWALSWAGACSFNTAGVDTTSESDGSSSEGGSASTSATSSTSSSSTSSTSSTSSLTTTGGATTVGPSTTWRRKLTLLHPEGEPTIMDVPVPVQLTPSELSETASYLDAGGADLRFLDDDGETVLFHEIERWDANLGALIWVRVPRIDPGGADHLWMQGGDLDAAPGEQQAAVWADGFELVLHLADDPGDGGPGAENAVGPANLAAYGGGMDGSSRVAGPVADALAFDGLDDLLTLTPNVTTDDWAALTISAWVRQSTAEDDRVICKAPSTDPPTTVFSLGVIDGNLVRVRLATDGEGGLYQQYDLPAGSAPLGAWTHAAFTWDAESDALALYVNGQLIEQRVHGGETLVDSMESIVVANVNAYGVPGQERFLAGALDEVRVSRVARPAAWIGAQYRGMMGELIEYGLIEPY